MPNAAVNMNSRVDRASIMSDLDGDNLVDYYIGEYLERRGCRQHLQTSGGVKEEVGVLFVHHKHEAANDDGNCGKSLGSHPAVSGDGFYFALQFVSLANDVGESVKDLGQISTGPALKNDCGDKELDVDQANA